MYMHDSDLQSLKCPHERLRWARLHWQHVAGAINPSAKNAADSLGMEPGTYRAYERAPTSSKHTKMDAQSAIRFGKKFHVSWIWLLTGDGTPFDEPHSEGFQRTMRLLEKFPEEDQDVVADIVEAYAKRAGISGG